MNTFQHKHLHFQRIKPCKKAGGIYGCRKLAPSLLCWQVYKAKEVHKVKWISKQMNFSEMSWLFKKKTYTKVICIDFISEQWKVVKMQYYLIFFNVSKSTNGFLFVLFLRNDLGKRFLGSSKIFGLFFKWTICLNNFVKVSKYPVV